jgi:hypothetical protein
LLRSRQSPSPGSIEGELFALDGELLLCTLKRLFGDSELSSCWVELLYRPRPACELGFKEVDRSCKPGSSRRTPDLPRLSNHHAIDRRVLEAMLQYVGECFGNCGQRPPSSRCRSSRCSGSRARRSGGPIGADRRAIFFLSGATEANSLALKGPTGTRRAAVTSSRSTEHRAVRDALQTPDDERVLADGSRAGV